MLAAFVFCAFAHSTRVIFNDENFDKHMKDTAADWLLWFDHSDYEYFVNKAKLKTGAEIQAPVKTIILLLM